MAQLGSGAHGSCVHGGRAGWGSTRRELPGDAALSCSASLRGSVELPAQLDGRCQLASPSSRRVQACQEGTCRWNQLRVESQGFARAACDLEARTQLPWCAREPFSEPCSVRSRFRPQGSGRGAASRCFPASRSFGSSRRFKCRVLFEAQESEPDRALTRGSDRRVKLREVVTYAVSGITSTGGSGGLSGASSPPAGGSDEQQGSRGEAASTSRLEMALALAFVICNMDKVNLSVAIIRMSQDLGWSASTAGVVQASFFWGYALTQLPGGWLARKTGGESLMKTGVLLWSLATVATPWAATSVPAMLLFRFLVGLGEGVAPSAATDTIARVVPALERARAVSFVFGSLNVGSVAGLLLSPVLVESLGWESVFVAFGGLGVLWCAAYSWLRGPSPVTPGYHPDVGMLQGHRLLEGQTIQHSSQNTLLSKASEDSSRKEPIPWKALLESPTVRALAFTHFCHDWGKYCVQAWLPSFYNSHYHLTLTQSSMAALAPPLASVAVAAAAGTLADRLVAQGTPVTQVTAFLAPAAAMAATCILDTMNANPTFIMLLLTSGLALSSFALAGLYCTHQDLSPKYSGVLLGLTNTAGALPGFVGVSLTGVLYDATNSWALSLFLPSIVVLCFGAAVWVRWVENAPLDFDALRQQREETTSAL